MLPVTGEWRASIMRSPVRMLMVALLPRAKFAFQSSLMWEQDKFSAPCEIIRHFQGNGVRLLHVYAIAITWPAAQDNRRILALHLRGRG